MNVGPRHFFAALAVSTLLAAQAPAQDEHWSRQFPKPQSSQKMLPGTGMSDAGGKPGIAKVEWHDGKLWFSGAWESGVDPTNLTKRQQNNYWYLWTWSPSKGWQVVCYFHSAQGGQGPDGVINDFEFLPDGRIVVAGEFTRLDNPGGTRYHNVDALAIYDPNEPTANRWQPLGSPQANGTVSQGGSIKSICYDPQGNDLYIGGAFKGFRFADATPHSYAIHRYDFDSGEYQPIMPGVGSTGAQYVTKVWVDTSTNPSTIYVGGRFHWTDGNGFNPAQAQSTARYTTCFAKWQEGSGWTTFPQKSTPKNDEAVLQRAGDFMFFDAAIVHDFLVDGDDIWIVGSFSEGADSGQTLRGIARWDAENEVWTDPTGKGGVGRECWSVAKAENGKLYFAGAFGARKSTSDFFDGFKSGDPAHMAISYDPSTGEWAQLGSGLSGIVMPEVRMCVNGNDVWFAGDIKYIGSENFGNSGKKDMQSWHVARWNETLDFAANPPETGDQNAPFEMWGPGASAPTEPLTTGNEHWSRQFPQPPRARGKESQMSGSTGMDVGTGTPDPTGLVWHGETLYFAGNWEAVRNERWYVWSWHKENGWNKIAWEGPGGKSVGVDSKPSGMELHDGKLYVYGPIANWSGIGIYDPASGEWSKLTGKTEDGREVVGNASLRGTGTIEDVAWDAGTGDMYLVGNWAPGIENPAYKHPKNVAAVLRIDKEGVYHTMGHDLMPENPAKPMKGIYCILIDETQDPSDIYVGGTFNYYGESPTHNSRMLYNVAKWDHEAQDWGPIGKGVFRRLSDVNKQYYPDGFHGLPALPEHFRGFLNAGFPRVRALVMDKEGNLYAGGTLAVLDDNPNVSERVECVGLARYDKAQDKWVPADSVGGVSRDIYQMSWLSDSELLLTGGFVYDNAFNVLHNVAVLDTAAGELKPLGGGLMRSGRSHVVAAGVVHSVAGDDVWFAGLFDHAGVNANSMVDAPIQSWYVARYNGKEDLDPNRGLEIGAVEPVQAPSGYSSKSYKVTLTAALADGEGEIHWFEKRSNGDLAQKGKGESFTANVRVKADTGDLYYYVCVKRPDGQEGGKLPVRIPVLPPE